MDAVLDALMQVGRFPFDPQRRIYWVFLLCSGFLALYYLWRQASAQQRSNWRWQRILSHNYWWHRSARIDYLMLPINAVIGALLITPLLCSSLAMAVTLQPVIHGLLSQPIFGGTLTRVALSPGAAIALFSVTAFLAEDLSRYWLHRLMHANILLWQFHRVHHSAEVLNPLTLYRVHPIEMLLFRLREVLVCGCIGALFMSLYPGQIREWEVLGTGLFNVLFNVAGANLRHSPVQLRFGIFERWFVSPAQHQLHHSILKQFQHCNYGSNLALWDRWFGTWACSKKDPINSIGLTRPMPQSLQAQYLEPIYAVLGSLRDVLKRSVPRVTAKSRSQIQHSTRQLQHQSTRQSQQ